MNYKFITIALTLFTLAISLSLGQDNSQKKPSHFHGLAWETPINDLFLAQSPPPSPDPNDPAKSLPAPADYEEIPLKITSLGRSEFVPYDKAKPLYFVRHVGALFKIAATLDLSAASDLPLLFFMPGKAKGSLEIKVLPDDLTSCPGGSFRFISLSTIPIKAVVDDQSTILQPNEVKILKPTLKESRVQMMLLRAEDNARQYSNLWVCNNTVRYMFFIVDTPHRPGSIDCLRLVDSVLLAKDPNQQSGTN